MSRYQMDDGTIVDTEKSKESWPEKTDFNGNNHISRATKDQWTHEKLYRSRKGRYYVEHTSQWQGSQPHVEWVSPEEAARWLLLMEHRLPADLEKHEAQIVE